MLDHAAAAQGFGFAITAEDPGTPLARAGVISTPHGPIHTPAFVVVGTRGRVHFLAPAQLRAAGVEAMICNGYHLFRKSAEIASKGQLAAYSDWHGPTITDSGGFQVMSLGSGLGKVVSMDRKDIAIARKLAAPHERMAIISDDGVEFQHPDDGKREFFSPEVSIQTQIALGADIMMAFDELTSIGDNYEYNVQALERTRKWAIRCLAERDRRRNPERPYQALYGVLQGAHYRDLREKAARDLGELDFDGYGLGGAFEKEALGEILGWTNRILPREKPRHLLGLSKPDDIFVGVAHGIDTFDCVAPTREARHGRVYTSHGNYNILRSRFKHDDGPLEPDCDCLTCAPTSPAFRSRAQVRALLKSHVEAERFAAFTCLSGHNVRFIVRLTDQIRAAIAAGSFGAFRDDWLARYFGTSAAAICDTTFQ